MSRLNEWRKELYISTVPVLGWMSGGSYLQMSPVAIVKGFFELLREPEQEAVDEKDVFKGCVVSCPTTDDDGNYHRHVLEPWEIATLANIKAELAGTTDPEGVETIFREITETYEHW